MEVYQSRQAIGQLEKRKGGYYFLKVDAEVVHQFRGGKNTRFLCKLERIAFSCGLNHFGDGHFFIILSTKRVKTLGRKVGDVIDFELREDPNPLGVELPQTLAALLQQDELLHRQFEQLTDGKKRSLIHAVGRIKDVDKSIQKTIELLNNGVRLRNKPML
jgi:hypothetical protein